MCLLVSVGDSPHPTGAERGAKLTIRSGEDPFGGLSEPLRMIVFDVPSEMLVSRSAGTFALPRTKYVLSGRLHKRHRVAVDAEFELCGRAAWRRLPALGDPVVVNRGLRLRLREVAHDLATRAASRCRGGALAPARPAFAMHESSV